MSLLRCLGPVAEREQDGDPLEILSEAMRWEEFRPLLAKVESFVPVSPFSSVKNPDAVYKQSV